MKLMRYLVIIEKAQGGYGAYVPDLPGCVAVGDSEDEVRQLIREAIDLHIEDLRTQGQPVPSPSSASEYVEAGVT
jgi:predicted RNase H-like HicB family nuclease